MKKEQIIAFALTIVINASIVGVSWGHLKAKVENVPNSISKSQIEIKLYLELELNKRDKDFDEKLNDLRIKLTRLRKKNNNH